MTRQYSRKCANTISHAVDFGVSSCRCKMPPTSLTSSSANTSFAISIKNANFSSEVPFFLLKLFSIIRLDTARIDKALCLEAN